MPIAARKTSDTTNDLLTFSACARLVGVTSQAVADRVYVRKRMPHKVVMELPYVWRTDALAWKKERAARKRREARKARRESAE